MRMRLLAAAHPNRNSAKQRDRRGITLVNNAGAGTMQSCRPRAQWRGATFWSATRLDASLVTLRH